MEKHHPEHLKSFAKLLSAKGGGDTGAPETKNNPIPREWYHTDWVADHTVAWLDSLDADDDWFCWMSFPDPHHPWDPPAVRAGPRAAGRTSTCRPATSARPTTSAKVLEQTPGPLARLLRGLRGATSRAARRRSCRRR